MIDALYVTSVVVVGLIVVALAVSLLTILFLLWRTSDTLGKVLFGVRAIAHRAAPVGQRLRAVNDDLVAVREALEAALPGRDPAGDVTDRKAQRRTVHT